MASIASILMQQRAAEQEASSNYARGNQIALQTLSNDTLENSSNRRRGREDTNQQNVTINIQSSSLQEQVAQSYHQKDPLQSNSNSNFNSLSHGQPAHGVPSQYENSSSLQQQAQPGHHSSSAQGAYGASYHKPYHSAGEVAQVPQMVHSGAPSQPEQQGNQNFSSRQNINYANSDIEYFAEDRQHINNMMLMQSRMNPNEAKPYQNQYSDS